MYDLQWRGDSLRRGTYHLIITVKKCPTPDARGDAIGRRGARAINRCANSSAAAAAVNKRGERTDNARANPDCA